MTSTERPDITLGQPGDLLASMPALLGFRPVDSLVVFALSGPRATELTLVLRADLPPPHRSGELARCLVPPLVQHGAVGVALVVVGGQDPDRSDELPYRALLDGCEGLFADAGLPAVHRLWLPDAETGRRWHCYDDCDCTGLLPDPAGTGLATLAAESGLSVYDRREDIIATLAPEPDDVLVRRSRALDRRSAETEPSDGTADPPTARMNMVRAAIENARTTPPELSDDDVVELISALTDHRVRDMCLDFDELPDLAAAQRLWTVLARAAPIPERAEAACLLAYTAYVQGDGVLAGIALDQAERADPGHRLTGLLRGALSIGLAPSRLRAAGSRAAWYARQEAPGPAPAR